MAFDPLSTPIQLGTAHPDFLGAQMPQLSAGDPKWRPGGYSDRYRAYGQRPEGGGPRPATRLRVKMGRPQPNGGLYSALSAAAPQSPPPPPAPSGPVSPMWGQGNTGQAGMFSQAKSQSPVTPYQARMGGSAPLMWGQGDTGQAGMFNQAARQTATAGASSPFPRLPQLSAPVPGNLGTGRYAVGRPGSSPNLGYPGSSRDLSGGTRAFPYGKPEPLTDPRMAASFRPSVQPPISQPASWEAGFRDTLRGPAVDPETAFRNTLRGPGGFHGDVARQPNMFQRAAGRVQGYFGGSPSTPSAAPPPVAAPSAAPAAAPPGISMRQRLSSAIGSVRQAGALGTAKNVARFAAKGTVLNPAWLASQSINLGSYAGDLDNVMRGENGINPGGTSVGQGLSNLAHAVPGAGGVVGTAWDWTLGPFAHAASNLGDLATLGVGSAFGNENAQRGLGQVTSNLGNSLANAWSGKSAEANKSQIETHGIPEGPRYDPEVVSWLQSLPNKGGGRGFSSMPVGPQQADLPSLLFQASQLMAEPHDESSPLHAQLSQMLQQAGGIQGQPGLPVPSPMMSGDPIEQSLAAALQRHLDTPPKLPWGPEAFDNLELNPSLGPGGPGPLVHNLMMSNNAAVAAHQQNTDRLMGLLASHRGQKIQGQAAMGESQARMLAAHADLARAQAMAGGDLGAMMNAGPAGMHVLEQQYPGLADAVNYPGVADLPILSVLSKNPDAQVEDWMGADETLHRLYPQLDPHAYIAHKLLEKFGPSGLEASRTPGWFGFGSTGANRSSAFQRHLGLIQ